MNKKPVVLSVVVGAVILYDNKVLLLQRNNDEKIYPNMWELPSGKKHPLENCEDALVREVKEETNLDVSEAKPFHVFSYQIEKDEEIKDSVQINYLVRAVDSGVIRISGEHQEFCWLDRGQVANSGVTKQTSITIDKAFELFDKKK